MTLSRDDLLKIEPATRDVRIAGLPDDIRLRCMTGTERDAFEQMCQAAEKDEPGGLDFLAGLLVRTLINGDGSRLFTDDEQEEVKKLPTSVLMPCFEASMKLNGLDKESEEELAKNSESDPREDSTSGSQYL